MAPKRHAIFFIFILKSLFCAVKPLLRIVPVAQRLILPDVLHRARKMLESAVLAVDEAADDVSSNWRTRFGNNFWGVVQLFRNVAFAFLLCQFV